MDLNHSDPSAGDMPEEYRPYFQGVGRFQQLPSCFGDSPSAFMVHFEAGARTRPHIHHSGQMLYIADGEGIVADGKGRHRVRPGDVVTVRPDEWHWHGATPESPMSHFTVQVTRAGDIEWDVEERDWATGYGG